MLYFFWSLAAFIIVLSILITVHELGHFWAARCCGVAVERCSIGFGRTLWRYSDKHGTEYIIAAIPLGGYVKILDERVDTVTPDRYHETFNYRSVWQRSAIIAAGPIFNFIFAILIYWLVFMIGVPGYRPIIGDIEPNSIAAQANLSPGMELRSIEGTVTPDWDSVRLKLMEKIGSRELKLGISSFGSTHQECKILNLRGLPVDHHKQDPMIALGIIPLGPHIEPVLTEISPGSAAMRAGLKAGDKIVQVDAKPIDTWHGFVNKIRHNPGQSLQLSIERDGIVHNINLLPDSKVMQEGKVTGFAGVVPKIIPLPEVYKNWQQYGPLPALVKASDKTWHLMRLTVSMLVKLITGDVKLNNLSGPISIAHGAGVSAEYGLIYYLMFLALISINLGIINLFPLPVLDGGHLLFLAIEKLKGDPVSDRVQDLFYRLGSILLVLLMGLAIFNDLSRLFYLIA